MVKILNILFLLSIFFGCSKVSKTEIKDYTKSTTIYSTPNLTFYKIYGTNQSYANLKIKKDEYFLCVHRKGGSFADQCLAYSKGEKLPVSTAIKLSGNVVKTKKEGVITIDSGSSPMTFFEGDLNGKKIWVSSVSLYHIFDDPKSIDAKNKDAYTILKQYIK